MKFIKSFLLFLNENKDKEDFEDKIKGDGYYKGISLSTARKKAAQIKAQSELDDDDPDAYGPLPGDTKGKKLLKTSKHTKKYHELFGNADKTNESNDLIAEEYEALIIEKFSTITATGLTKKHQADLIKMGANVKLSGPGWYIMIKTEDIKQALDYLDKEGIDVNESLNEKASGDRSPIDNDAIEKGLEKKSEETGVPVPLLRIVMRRGMAAWKSGRRPGAGQEQWGYARVNSFLTKGPGTWGRPLKDPVKGGPKGAYGADADVAKEVIKGGHDKDLKTS
jgi:hypothetical protein